VDNLGHDFSDCGDPFAICGGYVFDNDGHFPVFHDSMCVVTKLAVHIHKSAVTIDEVTN
jgi:hypothetical protein